MWRRGAEAPRGHRQLPVGGGRPRWGGVCVGPRRVIAAASPHGTAPSSPGGGPPDRQGGSRPPQGGPGSRRRRKENAQGGARGLIVGGGPIEEKGVLGRARSPTRRPWESKRLVCCLARECPARNAPGATGEAPLILGSRSRRGPRRVAGGRRRRERCRWLAAEARRSEPLDTRADGARAGVGGSGGLPRGFRSCEAAAAKHFAADSLDGVSCSTTREGALGAAAASAAALLLLLLLLPLLGELDARQQLLWAASRGRVRTEPPSPQTVNLALEEKNGPSSTRGAAGGARHRPGPAPHADTPTMPDEGSRLARRLSPSRANIEATSHSPISSRSGASHAGEVSAEETEEESHTPSSSQ